MRLPAIPVLAVLLLGQTALAQSPIPKPTRTGHVATPTAVVPGRVAFPLPAPSSGAAKLRDYDPQRLLAGHLLRRIGFGPNPTEMKRVLEIGTTAYIDEQLNPSRIDDSAAEAKFAPATRSLFNDYKYIRRWYTRMVYSRRQLQEKMTLLWHEHFATSNAKVGVAHFMGEQEETLRKDCLGSFRQLLVDMTKDKAMLYWLDNNYNSGTDTDDDGNPVPPNENYGRELMQLFSLGTVRLNMDGTPVTGADGEPLANYTEDDVKAVARSRAGTPTTATGAPRASSPTSTTPATRSSSARRSAAARAPTARTRSRTSSTSSCASRRLRRSSRRSSSRSSRPRRRRPPTSGASRPSSGTRTGTSSRRSAPSSPTRSSRATRSSARSSRSRSRPSSARSGR
jgi:hypothetical protein